MAFYGAYLNSQKLIPQACNLGLDFGVDKFFFFGGYDGVLHLDDLMIYDLRKN